MILNCWDLSNEVWFVTKTKQHNNETELTVRIEKKIKLSWPAGLCAVSDENKTGQQRD